MFAGFRMVASASTLPRLARGFSPRLKALREERLAREAVKKEGT